MSDISDSVPAVEDTGRVGWTADEYTPAVGRLHSRVLDLEDAHHHVLTLIDRLRTDDEMGPCIDAIQRVAVEALEPKPAGTERPEAAHKQESGGSP